MTNTPILNSSSLAPPVGIILDMIFEFLTLTFSSLDAPVAIFLNENKILQFLGSSFGQFH